MKRIIVPSLGLALFVALLAWLSRGADGGMGKWQPLPKGGEVRVAAITYGTWHEFQTGDRTLLQRVRAWFAALGKPKRPAPFRQGPMTVTTSHSLLVWLEVRDSPGGLPSVDECTLRLPDGEVLRSGSGGGSTFGPGGRGVWHVTFRTVPHRVPTLAVSVKIDGQPFTFTVRNPAARERLPAWTPRPLPQTVPVGDTTLTLRKVGVKPGYGGRFGPRWRMEPVYAITRGGEKADAWFSLTTKFSDPGGNEDQEGLLASEPVWRVTATAKRTERFPFGLDDVTWLGRLDPTQAGTVFTIPPEARRFGALSAQVLGAGQYEIARDGSIKAVPKTAPKQKWDVPVACDYQNRITTLRLDQPKLLFLCQRNTPLVLLREDGGEHVQPGDSQRQQGTDHVLLLVARPARPVQIGLAEPDELHFDFYIAAPEPPGLKKTTPSP